MAGGSNLVVLSQFAERIAPILLDASLKGIAILALAGLATLAMQRVSAAARHLVWSFGIGGLLLLPVASVVLPGWHVLPAWPSVVPPAERSSTSSAGVGRPAPISAISNSARRQGTATAVRGIASPASAAPTLIAAEPRVTPPPKPVGTPADRAPIACLTLWWLWVIPVWAVGVALGLMPVVAGLLSLWRLGRSSSVLTGEPWRNLLGRAHSDLRLTRPVTLLLSDRRAMPMAWGTLKPKVLLPEDALAWSDDRRRVVLLHELGHVKRGDCGTYIMARLACALHWFNPLAWLAARRLLAESETACDDLVLGVGLDGPDYAQHLVDVASGAKAQPLTTYIGIAMARPSKLEGRLLAVLDATRSRRGLTRTAVSLTLGIALLVILPMGSLRPTAKAQDSAQKRTRSTRTAKVGKATAWHRTLSSGGAVELVGVCYSPSKGKQWWRPDGSPLPEAPYDSLGFGPPDPSTGSHQAYEFAMSVSGQPATDESAHFYVLGARGGGAGRVRKRDRVVPGVLGAGVAIQRLDRRCTVRFGTPAGPWRTVAKSEGVGDSSVQAEGSTFTFSDITEGNGRASVTVVHDYRPKDTEHRVVALDRAGIFHDYCASHTGVASTVRKGPRGRRYEFRIPKLADVAAFCVQTRPIEFVEFRDIPLAPASSAAPTIPRDLGEPDREPPKRDPRTAPVLRYLKWEYGDEDVFPPDMQGYWTPTGLRVDEDDIDPFAKGLPGRLGLARCEGIPTLRLWFRYDGPVDDFRLWPQFTTANGEYVGAFRGAKRLKRDPGTGKGWLQSTARAINGWPERAHIRIAHPTEDWRILKALFSPLPHEPLTIDKNLVWSYGPGKPGGRGPTTLLKLLFKGTKQGRTPYESMQLAYRQVLATEEGRTLRHKALQWLSTPEGEVMAHTFRVSAKSITEVRVETRATAMTTIRDVPLRPVRDAEQQQEIPGARPSSPKGADGAHGESASERASEIEQALNSPVSLDFTNTPLPDVIRFLQKRTGIRMLLDPRIAKAAPTISVRLENARLQEALDAIVKQAAKLTYRVGKNAVAISDARGFAYYFMRTYKVQGLFPAPQGEMKQAPKDPRVPTCLDELVERIVRDIEPRSWRMALGATRGVNIDREDMTDDAKGKIKIMCQGGSMLVWHTRDVHHKTDDAKGQIMCQGGSILVWHTREVHHKITELLRSLRQGSGAPPAPSAKKQDAGLARPPDRAPIDKTGPKVQGKRAKLFAKGWRALRTERFGEAIKIADQLTRLNPGDEAAMILLREAFKAKHAKKLRNVKDRSRHETKKQKGTGPAHKRAIHPADSVASPEQGAADYESRTYDVSDILAAFGRSGIESQPGVTTEMVGRQRAIDLLTYISAIVAPDSWRSAVVGAGGTMGDLDVELCGERGGGQGTLVFKDEKLTIRQTATLHRQVVDVIVGLRERMQSVARRRKSLTIVAAEPPSFSPVTETRHYQNDPSMHIDIDRARTLKVPGRLRANGGPWAVTDWISKNGADVVALRILRQYVLPNGGRLWPSIDWLHSSGAEVVAPRQQRVWPTEHRTLIGVMFRHSIAVPVPDSKWDSMPPADLLKKAQDHLRRARPLTRPTSLNSGRIDDNYLRGTHLVITLEGGCGLLQATQVGRLNTLHLRVRYKMLRRPGASGAAAAAVVAD